RLEPRVGEPLRLQRRESIAGSFFAAEHSQRDRIALRSAVDDRDVLDAAGSELGEALVGRGATGGRRQKYPVTGDDLDFFLRHQARKIQWFETRQRAIAVGIRQ